MKRFLTDIMLIVNPGNAPASVVLQFVSSSVHEPGVFYTGMNLPRTSKSSDAVDQLSNLQKIKRPTIRNSFKHHQAKLNISKYQGVDENFGMRMLAMEEVLRNVEGGRRTVAVSIYEVLILADAQGKITLKGLSKVQVKSMAEFQKLYCGESSSKKSTKSLPLELPRRSHKALMIHILASDEGENAKCAGTLYFVDLAGYENTRSSIDGTNCVEIKQINKSLNALLNVIYAINASESRVPYRESKLARMLLLYFSMSWNPEYVVSTFKYCVNVSLHSQSMLVFRHQLIPLLFIKREIGQIKVEFLWCSI